MVRCPLCPRKRAPVPSVGPKPARILLLGEQPSWEEDKRGEPFVGKTGVELTGTYLPILGTPRSELHIFNARACSEYDYANPTPEQAASCSSVHLGPLLAEVKPDIIVPMGAIACSLFPEIGDLNLQHGIPVRGHWGPWNGILFPTYHPSAGLHQTGYMIALMQDFDALSKLLKNLDLYGRAEMEGAIEDGWTPFPEDPHPNPDYSTKDIPGYLDCMPAVLELASDTESKSTGECYCVTISHTPGTGRLIYSHDREGISWLRDWLRRSSTQLIFHNYLHDVVPFAELDLPIINHYDTMVRAYNLCLGGGADDEQESRAGRGSLSLKILAYRHCQMRMNTFRETVFPHSIPKVQDYLRNAQLAFALTDSPPLCICGHAQSLHSKRGKSERRTGVCLNTKCRCSGFKKVPKAKVPEDKELGRLYNKVSKLLDDIDNKPDTDPWDRIKKWHDHDHRYLLDTLGAWPVPSIEHVPEPTLLNYACRDADATLRLKQKLDTLQPWVFWEP